ncbi:hypothetical protein AMECASPLE_022244 [Ameca splendens]|uniref:Ig-like domain-containing protein n=1 Tax=Ameca splendens TaxID=208324 RepID=A0ABV0Z1S9_9TELE
MVSGSCSKLIEAVVGLLLVLLGVSHGVKTYCDGRKGGAQCFGLLGGTVLLQLMDNTSHIPKYKWKYNRSTILKNIRTPPPLYTLHSRYNYIPSNGTLSITNLSRNDSGEYTLETFDSDGRNSGTQTLQLTVEAPVSLAQMIHECLTQGQMKVSCLSEGGDSPQYSWTLDGHILTDSELFSRNNDANVIVLRQNISGRLVCSARNQVSSFIKEIQISTCGFIFINCSMNGTQIYKWVFKENNSLCVEPITTTSSGTPIIKIIMEMWPIIAGAFGGLLIMLVISFVIICVKRKKQHNKLEEEYVELEHADTRTSRRQEEQHGEIQEEYSQVKKKPRHSDVKLHLHKDGLYANVHKNP